MKTHMSPTHTATQTRTHWFCWPIFRPYSEDNANENSANTADFELSQGEVEGKGSASAHPKAQWSPAKAAPPSQNQCDQSKSM